MASEIGFFWRSACRARSIIPARSEHGLASASSPVFGSSKHLLGAQHLLTLGAWWRGDAEAQPA